MNRIKELRKEKKITQQELADMLNVSKRTVLYWEKGERELKSDKARKLADYFGVSIGYLLGYTEQPISDLTDWEILTPEAMEAFDNYVEFEADRIKNRVDEISLKFITDLEKLNNIKSDTLVAIRFIESIRDNLSNGIVKPYSYAWEMEKTSSLLLDLLDRIKQREKELTDD